ncbi:MAG: hypothetical protein Sylvanvirus1_39 [Sylvanvirus sp.]|uniref:Progestin and adipoQ receptor family member 3 n=1 Tax=Sylvanvirus sp. TaxID=2487774 RepID=A0A3G5AK02_9VIRU|nr:MAG: hypothetical protein Sylvanvirus1_39 [Sylvanvirus sp.]
MRSQETNNDGCATRHTYQLETIHKVPEFLQCPHIYKGYRVFLSPAINAKSFFLWHNESLNVWTHAFAFFIYVWLAVQFNYDVWTGSHQLSAHMSSSDIWIYNLYIVSGMSSWWFSCLYHLFNNTSKCIHDRLFCIDTINIAFAIFGSYLPGIVFGFACYPFYQILYTSVVSLLVLTYVFLIQTNRMLLSIVAFSIIPTIHYSWIHSTIFPTIPISTVLIPFMQHATLSAIGFLMYTFKIPERFYPGTFDYIAHSHQWWHIAVALGSWMWMCGLHKFLECKHYALCPP